ncbi:hypothetical protein L596_010681 [Steinernema carpocapsae]|uniref:Uncharacterized protein n=1 Tax=Steinernema carpocapsae TaxID=34508 RepID=A0A4U5PJ94_STECR|nr:hypothetical protein L596_010681 [Steinernema carpocapsae]
MYDFQRAISRGFETLVSFLQEKNIVYEHLVLIILLVMVIDLIYIIYAVIRLCCKAVKSCGRRRVNSEYQECSSDT